MNKALACTVISSVRSKIKVSTLAFCTKAKNFVVILQFLDKFLPFKCPLSTEYDRDLDESQRFHPSMLVSYTESVERRMGLVVDLTKTDRYYDKRELLQSGIGHREIICAGLVI